ncbi:hypothetical protein [Phenylobacterium sp.]|jgi:hypothetical protein|uniref:hypothetical protein n=1 Tax=Phenylobacterium sp. TaxID=1871053 RepID=UPI002E30A889|nr:hypothetical protein [Phenylobacterium sp.]HEX4708868.1 hypothetical protein [Phenylobacterium sp.]
MSVKSKIALACVLALGAAGLNGAVAQESQPNVRMAREVVAAASAFETYTRTAGAIEPGFAGPRAVAGALQVGASHDPRQLEAGMIAYAAMAALQDRGFVEGVQRMVADDAARDEMVRRLTYNPETAIELPGADGAAARARAALLRQIEPLIADGRRVKQAAYDIQHQEWSRATVADARERLAMVKQLAVQPFSPDEADATRLFRAVSARIEGHAAAAPSPVVMRGLALAALALAGQAGDENGEALKPLLTETRSASCVRIAKLNLFQCMAVAGPHYEDVFCLGEHAMIEPGQCMAQAAGAEAAPQSMQTASMLIPIARPAPGER